jgi:hypothetical protein
MLLLALLAPPSAAEAQAYTLSPEQPSVAAGEWISFRGSGFTRDERVVTWATAPDQAVIGGNYTHAEGGGGAIEFAFKVPDDAIGGRWAMTAYGHDSKTPVVATFEVQGREPTSAAPQAQVAPPSGPPGTNFAFAAFGYEDGEKVSYWLTGPDGQVHDAYPEGAKTNSDGRVDITWPAPADALRGTWVITIQGLESDVARGVPFEIR